MSRGEYRAAMNGNSWKFQLMWNIDRAMKKCGSRKDFVQEMKRRGYDMIWTKERKYITYICPNGNRCRDIKLHEQKYLKGRMEDEFKLRERLSKQFNDEPVKTDEWREHGENERDTIPTDSVRYTEGNATGGNGNAEDSSNIPTDTVRDDRWTIYEERPGELHTESNGNSARQYEEYAETSTEHQSESDSGTNGDYTTGWEKEREIYYGYIPDDKYSDSGPFESDEREDFGAGGFERRTGESYAENHHYGGNDFGGIVGTALHGVVAFADIIESDSDDKEERKKEQEAKATGGNLGAVIGVGAAILSALVNKDEQKDKIVREQNDEIIREQNEIDEISEEDIEDDEYIDFMM